MARPVCLDLFEGEQLAIVGDNAAGKTRLADMIVSACPSDSLQSISFRDTYGVSDSSYYLQKRWNQIEIDPEFNPTVRQQLYRIEVEEESLRERLLDFFGLRSLLDRYLISLSSGELRKFHLAKALLRQPRILLLDNPFIGLDEPTRAMLSDLLGELAQKGLTLILVMPRLDVIPAFLTHIVKVEGLQAGPKTQKDEFLKSVRPSPKPDFDASRILSLPEKDLSQESFYPKGASPEIIRCNSVSIRYGERTILKDLDWVVREGERWVVSGANGSGKSTLLSCVCADNPQSYACDIELFSHRRGGGETIWDIKRHIGYVSPEMHRAYQKNIPADNVVASGLFDTVGLFRHASPEQMAVCHEWMDIFGIKELARQPFLKLSSGEQRLCLLARAFVKDPELLILDEPFHGLDEGRSALAKAIIDAFAQRAHKTLIMISHFKSEYPSCIDHELVLQRHG